MSEYVAPIVPVVPAPVLPENPTDAQWTAFAERARLFLQREEFLSNHYEQWHIQQHRAEWASLISASNAVQSARVVSEQRVAEAGQANADAVNANAAALRFAATEMRTPPPVVTFPS